MGLDMGDEVRIPIQSDQDIPVARRETRSLAAALRFSPGDSTLLATAISVLARNIVTHARTGEIHLKVIKGISNSGIQAIARGDGPEDRNVKEALRDGSWTSGSIGPMSPGVRRLVDEFYVLSEVNGGTTVLIRKWKW